MLVKLHSPGQICAKDGSSPSDPQKEGEGGAAGRTQAYKLYSALLSNLLLSAAPFPEVSITLNYAMKL